MEGQPNSPGGGNPPSSKRRHEGGGVGGFGPAEGYLGPEVERGKRLVSGGLGEGGCSFKKGSLSSVPTAGPSFSGLTIPRPSP